ncbi:hypothetical protein [Haliangium sp.]|uniref:hypothetical protein n=1 Tax=Haliangium sp. TaxID=2663208 RepID=UPI003D13A852
MSQSQKPSGSTNISDLKARLGLKKSGPSAGKGAVPPPGGIVAPPGAGGQKRALTVPAPPGAAPPPPEIPDASEDPFAAMSAIANQGRQAATASPEFVIVNDGKPVESVDNRSALLRFGIPAAVLAGTLVVGLILGNVLKGSSFNDEAQADAVSVGEDIKRVRKSLLGVRDVLWVSLEKGPGGQAFPPNDEELTEALADESILPTIDPEIFTKRFYVLDGALVSQILGFYTDVITIREQIDRHVKATQSDAKAMKDGGVKLEGAKPNEGENRYIKSFPYRYGVIITAADQFGAQLVAIGPPYCQDGKASTTGTCEGGPPIGFGVRADETDSVGWKGTELGNPQNGAVPLEKLLPLASSAVFESLRKGTEASVAEAAYMRRVNELKTLVENTITSGSELEATLEKLSF